MPYGTLLNDDVELLLAGGVPGDEALATLAPVLASLRAEYAVTVPEHEVVTRGADLAAKARQAASPTVGAPATPARRHRTLRRRLAPVLAAAVLLAGMTGVAYAVEDSLPGDAFYGWKMVFEGVGILSGGVEERVAEAHALFDKGQVDEALAHAALAAGNGDPLALEAALALERAADALRANEQGSDNAIDVRNRLADRFDWMADTDETGRDFGQGVAERAPRSTEPGSQGGKNAADNAANANENAADPDEVGNRPEHAGSGSGQEESPGNSGKASQGEGGKPSENPGQGGGKPDKSDDDS